MTGRAALGIAHESDVGEARRAASAVAEQAGLPAGRLAAVALLATELAANLVRHAQAGELLVHVLPVDGAPVVELISLDRGPGMADVSRCLTDGYSTAGTMGAGLGGVRRMADAFDLWSRPEWGTVLVARVGDGQRRAPTSRFEWSCISSPAPHEQVCGDAWEVAARDSVLSAMVADGLGHGPLAAEASQAAGRLFSDQGCDEPTEYLERAHRVLGRTRGAAISIARGDASEQRLVFAGVGNVSGAIVGADEHRSMAAHNGTIGATLPRVQSFEYGWPERSLLILHSDGLKTRWSLQSYPGLHTRHPALVAAALYKDHRRANDDATVLVARTRAA